MNIEIKQEIPLNRIADLLCGAIEGGSNYWYMITDKVEPTEWTFWDTHNEDKVKYLHLYPLNEGGALMIDDSKMNEDERELQEPVRVDMAQVKKGLELFSQSQEYAHHWRDFMSENEDGITCDVFLQFCVFGKVIYG